MDANYLTNPVVFLVEVIFGLYALVVLLRFLLQWVKADFHNPLSQFIVKATSPMLNPIRRIVPGIAGLDIAALALAWLVTSLQLLLVLWLNGQAFSPQTPFLLAIPELVGLTINIFLFAILIQVVISWINPGNYNPAIAVLYQLTEPLLGPARRRIPSISGIDFSPMVVMLGLVLLKMLLIPPIHAAIQTLL
jgi:YggT family protein